MTTSDAFLEPGQKVTNSVYDVTCVAGQGALTACIDNRYDHGFVLRQSGSWTF